jgi:hypothetical protein
MRLASRSWLVPAPVWAIAVVVGGVSAFIFAEAFHQQWASDLPSHLLTVRAMLDTHTVPGDPLYFVTVAALAGFQKDTVALHVAAVSVLGVAVAAKYLLSAYIALRETDAAGLRLRVSGEAGLVVLVALLPFAFSLPTDHIFLGQEPPNVFHNSTTIFLMPFALGLFFCSAQYLRTGGRGWLAGTAATALVNVAIKPSFVLAVVVVFPLVALVRLRGARELFWALGATAFMVVLLVGQYLYIYKTGASETLDQATGTASDVASHVRIDPFNVWSHYSSSIPLSFLASFAFPLVALAVYGRRLWEYDLVRYAFALLGVSLAIFILLTETGPREFDGNFGWQVIVSSYIAFLVTLIRVWDLRYARPVALEAVVWVAFAAHIVAGGIFLHYYFVHHTYI